MRHNHWASSQRWLLAQWCYSSASITKAHTVIVSNILRVWFLRPLPCVSLCWMYARARLVQANIWPPVPHRGYGIDGQVILRSECVRDSRKVCICISYVHRWGYCVPVQVAIASTDMIKVSLLSKHSETSDPRNNFRRFTYYRATNRAWHELSSCIYKMEWWCCWCCFWCSWCWCCLVMNDGAGVDCTF